MEDIAPYNRRGHNFARDGVLEGAVGTRIFSGATGDQIERVVSTLRMFPASRRAVVQVFSPQDLADPPLDTPCTISLQYLIRRGRLDSITSMRSQSAALLLPYDVFLFSMLQEVVAVELGLELGRYHHFCGSLHYYDDEASLVNELISERTVTDDDLMMKPMPRGALASIRKTIAAERDLRRRLAIDNRASFDVKQYGLHQYWSDLLTVLVTKLRPLSSS